MEVLSHVIAVGKATLGNAEVSWEKLEELHARPEVLLNCADPAGEQRMKAEVDQALRTGDSVGGVFEVVAHNVPPGLGTYAQWDERLDGMLHYAVDPAKNPLIFDIDKAQPGPDGLVHYQGDFCMLQPVDPQEGRRRLLFDVANRGQEIVVRGYLKPISTLRRPLGSVDFSTREPVKAAYERSDVCVVPAAGVAAEAMVALTLARCALEKFGGDSMAETQRNFAGYKQQLREF